MKKWVLVLLILAIYINQWRVPVLATLDREILSDPVANYYEGSLIGKSVGKHIDFVDISAGYWARESISRLGALSVVKGYKEGNIYRYRPSQVVSKQETLAFLLRVIGQETAAMKAAEQLSTDEALLTLWSKGYLQVAANNNLITAAELADGLVMDQSILDPQFNFIRSQATTREEVAKWVVKAINSVNPGQIAPIYTYNKIFDVTDWAVIGKDYVPYVEAVMAAGIMVGDGRNFRPKGELTRAEMAQIIINMDKILYSTMGLTLKAGTVGNIQDRAKIGTLTSETIRTILIRNEAGLVDQIALTYYTKEGQQTTSKDVPVYRQTGVRGLNTLQEGEQIVYVVNQTTGTLIYVYAKGVQNEVKVKGILQPLTGILDGKITIKNAEKVSFTYQMAKGLYDDKKKTLKIGGTIYPVANAPVANTVTLVMHNQVVTRIDYEGAIPLSNEVSGIVKEINLPFGFITLQDWNGKEVTKYFNKDQVLVEKEHYYDTEDEVGYIDELFPNYAFDERDTTIEAIEVGDIVHVRLDSKDINYISRISGKTNYGVKFGEILEVTNQGGKGLIIRLAYGDTTIGTLNVAATTPVMLLKKNIGISQLKVGHMVKILLNQGVVAPGQVVETVKQIEVDPYGNVLANIYKGELGYINHAGKTVDLLNNYRLTKVGWDDYQQQLKLELPDKMPEIYYHGKIIGLNYAEKYLKIEGMHMYVVTENYHDRERVAKIVFEAGQERILPSGTVSYSNGYDLLKMVGRPEKIATDLGTIVIKDNHVVAASSILSPDYAQIVTGNQDLAVVVHIRPEPKNDAISIFRGRIKQIEKGHQVTVASNALLKDMTWVYSPIKRIYTLSYDTKIINKDGVQPLETFIDYSELSKVDEVYTIVAEGTKATHLVKNPYATEGVVGEIYNIDQAGIISIKSVLVYDSTTKLWKELSYKNNFAQIETVTETIIIKNNHVVSIDDLEVGDQIRGMITVDLAKQLKIEGNRKATAYILFVEK